MDGLGERFARVCLNMLQCCRTRREELSRTVVLVSAERSANLRAYDAKPDRLDSFLLARLPLMHPEGLHPERGLGPGDPLRRAAKLHSTLVKRGTPSLARLDALLEILGPAWHAAFAADLGN